METKQTKQPIITRALITKMLQDQLAVEKQDLADHEQLKAAMSALDGQSLTSKRLEKHLPEGWDYEFKYSMAHAISPRKKQHLLKYDSESVFMWNTLERKDSWAHEGAKERIKQLEGMLNAPVVIENMQTLFRGIQKAMNDLKWYSDMIENEHNFDSFNNPIYYQLLKMTGTNSKLMQDIKYGKLNEK